MASDSKQDTVVVTEPEAQVTEVVAKAGKLSRVGRKIWGEDVRERKYLRKLDAMLL